MTQLQLLHLLDGLFEVDEGTVRLEDNFRDLRGWSSLTFLGLIALVDEECGVTLAPSVVLSLKTVKDLVILVQEQISSSKMAA